ncbi:MAG TPA: DUF4105 domain-containing protein [Polyangia bacterium]|jgi:hypothetical protein|nr:DUF4105 domain-containing protein [Polyangia bacterium]
MQRFVLAVLLMGALSFARIARADETPVVAPAADPLSIYVVTFGPGDHPFFKFGHDALLVRDRAAGTERVYNFGTFAFGPGLIGEFLHGRLTYWLSVSNLAPTVASYERENRTIVLQELALPPQTKAAMRAALDDNARPDKRAYKYDYFLDNCATRVRDAVDRATGGALRDSARAPGRLTLRDQALRMTADTPWLWLALDLVLAGATDRPIDRWGEMYIPEELERGLRAVNLEGRPLVASETVLFAANRPPPLEWPPARGVTLLLVGLGIGLVFVALGWSAPNRPAVRALLGLTVAVWGLVVGFLGCFLLYAWALTDHVVTHRNENILLCAPWAVALAVLGVGVAFGSRRLTLGALRVAVASLLLALAGWGLKAHPAFHQHNAALIALLLPPWFGMAIGLLHARHGS